MNKKRQKKAHKHEKKNETFTGKNCFICLTSDHRAIRYEIIKSTTQIILKKKFEQDEEATNIVSQKYETSKPKQFLSERFIFFVKLILF